MLQLVEREQHSADRQHQQDAARRIEFFPHRGACVGRQQPGEDECAEGKWDAEPEHRRPADDRYQQAGNWRTQRATEADDHGVDAEDADARCFGIQAGREGWSAAKYQCGADALHHACGEQRAIAWCHGAQHEGHRAPATAGQEDAPIAEHVADTTEHQHQRRVGQRVGNDDPLDRRYRQSKGPCDVRECEVDRRVEWHDQRAKRHYQHAQAGSRDKAMARCKAKARNKERARAHHALLALIGAGLRLRRFSSVSVRP